MDTSPPHTDSEATAPHTFYTWWQGFLDDWRRRYGALPPPKEERARIMFEQVRAAQEREDRRISGTWQRIESGKSF
jgi:hypothetical protein